MKSAIVELADRLNIDSDCVSELSLAKTVCTTVLSNVFHAENQPIQALHWNSGMTYMGIGVGQIEKEVAEILSSDMASAQDMIRICDRMEEVRQASEKLSQEIERFLPHKNPHGSQFQKTVTPWRGGIGGMCMSLKRTHEEFDHGMKKTAARIRAQVTKQATESLQVCMEI